MRRRSSVSWDSSSRARARSAKRRGGDWRLWGGRPSGDDRTVRLWDLSDGKEQKRFEGYTDNVYSVVFTPDGKHFLSACQNLVRLWDLKSGKELRQYKGHTRNVVHIAVSSDGE